jgi:hypothetical protein
MSASSESELNTSLEARINVMEFYSTKVENHIGYLISISLGIAALLVDLGQNSFPFEHRNFLLTVLMMGALYMFIRIYYWSSLQSAVPLVKAQRFSGAYMDTVLFEENLYGGLIIATRYCVFGTEGYPNIYGGLPRIADQKKTLFQLLIGFGIIIFLIIEYIFPIV